MANTLGGVLLPRLTVQIEDDEIVGSGIVRAVDGTPHTAYVKDIVRGTLTCSYITYEQYLALLGVKRNAKGGRTALHLDEWGSGFKMVYITRFHATRTPFFDQGVWHASGRTLEIDIEEA